MCQLLQLLDFLAILLFLAVFSLTLSLAIYIPLGLLALLVSG